MAILADLVSHFPVRVEPLATEALNKILGRSKPTRIAFAKFCKQFEVNVSSEIRFESEDWSKEGGRPDLVGYIENRIVLIIEGKFGAGLTENQPVGYLGKFSSTDPGLLLFVVPERRRQALWNEICRTCNENGLDANVQGTCSELLARVGDNRLGLVSWRNIIAFLQNEVGQGDSEAVQDLMQLNGLCERMDEDAFLPFRREELTDGNIPRISTYATAQQSHHTSHLGRLVHAQEHGNG